MKPKIPYKATKNNKLITDYNRKPSTMICDGCGKEIPKMRLMCDECEIVLDGLIGEEDAW